jgi:hypothetical protein
VSQQFHILKRACSSVVVTGVWSLIVGLLEVASHLFK